MTDRSLMDYMEFQRLPEDLHALAVNVAECEANRLMLELYMMFGEIELPK